MAAYRVKHHIFGDGVAESKQDGHIVVKFCDKERTFATKEFNKYFEIYDSELQQIINQANTVSPSLHSQSSLSKTTSVCVTPTPTNTHSTPSRFLSSANSLLGPRSQSIPILTEKQMFEIVGYMARPGRISSIEAEVPTDGRDKLFETLFPGQTYRPITLGYTPSGMPNKLSPQFRINFSNIRNCPSILKENMGKGNSGCIGRINKSRFVLTIVQNYGFKFGDWQDLNAIRKIAADRSYLDDFERGYSL